MDPVLGREVVEREDRSRSSVIFATAFGNFAPNSFVEPLRRRDARGRGPRRRGSLTALSSRSAALDFGSASRTFEVLCTPVALLFGLGQDLA